MSDRTLFNVIAHYLRTELFPRGDLVSQRVLLGLYRLIAKGDPVTIESLGATLGIDGVAVKEVIELVDPSRVQYDEAGRIIAFAGHATLLIPHANRWTRTMAMKSKWMGINARDDAFGFRLFQGRG